MENNDLLKVLTGIADRAATYLSHFQYFTENEMPLAQALVDGGFLTKEFVDQLEQSTKYFREES